MPFDRPDRKTLHLVLNSLASGCFVLGFVAVLNRSGCSHVILYSIPLNPFLNYLQQDVEAACAKK